VVDGEEQDHYDMLSYGGPVFSPDSKRLGYFAERDGTWFAVIDGIENALDETPIKVSIKFSPDSERVVYATWVNDQEWFWTVDGCKHNIYKHHGMSAFTPDSKHFIYTATKGNRGYLVTDGKEGKSNYSRVGPFRISPDSEHLAYTGAIKTLRKYRYYMVWDGVRGKVFDAIQGRVIFSPDSQRIAYRAKSGKSWLVVVDENPGKRYQNVLGLVFSPDSKHLAYVGKKGKKYVIVVDGNEVKQHDQIYAATYEKALTMGNIIFDSPDQLHYLARDKEEISLHEINLAA
jgi:protease II